MTRHTLVKPYIATNDCMTMTFYVFPTLNLNIIFCFKVNSFALIQAVVLLFIIIHMLVILNVFGVTTLQK